MLMPRERVYPVPGIYSQGGGTHTLWGPPLCEVPGIYAGYRIYKIMTRSTYKAFSLYFQKKKGKRKFKT